MIQPAWNIKIKLNLMIKNYDKVVKKLKRLPMFFRSAKNIYNLRYLQIE